MLQQKELQEKLLEEYKEIVRKWMPDQEDLNNVEEDYWFNSK